MRNNQSPSLYSIYQNALPYYLDRVDVCLLTEGGEEFASQFVQSLISGNLEIQIDASNHSAEKLRHLYFESKNIEKTRGPRTFGFGYPFFIETFESELIIAPMFTWYLTLEPSQNRVDSWIIKFDSSNHLLPNYKLIRHIESQNKVQILEKFEHLALSNKLGKDNLVNLLNNLSSQLNIENSFPDNFVIPSPGIDEIGALVSRGCIFWAGVFGLYPPQNIRGLESNRKPEEALIAEKVEVDESLFVYNYLPTDPFQASGIESIYKQKSLVIEGESTSGKTQTLVNLIMNALLNGEKCLIVSERVASLKKAQESLSRIGLNQHHFLLDDELSDRGMLLELLRMSAESIGREVDYNEEDYQYKRNQYIRAKNKLDAAYEVVQKKILGKYDWTDVVGLFLNSNRIEGKELLTGQLNNVKLELTSEEYEELKNGILSARPLYQKVNTLKHPLASLNNEIFSLNTKQGGLGFIKKSTKTFLQKAGALHHRFLSKSDKYSARLKEHYERYFNKLFYQVQLIKDLIAENTDQFGSDFSQSTSSSPGMFSFSSKKKKLHESKDFLTSIYSKLLRDFESRRYFEFQFPDPKQSKNIPKLVQLIDDFEIALNEWRGKINHTTQEEILRLNSKTVHPDLDYEEQIKDLEYSLDVMISELNESGLYQNKFENKTLTIPQRQKYLESIIENLENTKINLRDFDDFYAWQKNWLSLSEVNRQIIVALIKVKPKDWVAAFESWFFNKVLQKHEKIELPNQKGLIPDFADSYHALKPLIINRIKAFWLYTQFEELKKLKKERRKDYDLAFSKGNKLKDKKAHLFKIFDTCMDGITSIFPVFFVTPKIGSQVFPDIEGYFDLLIFDEANRFSVESASSIAHLGKRVLIFGSNDTFGNETSLLQYAKENTVPHIELENRYANRELEDKSVAPKNGIHALLRQFPQKFEVENVEGRFNEKQGTNDVEAQQIIRLLNQIDRMPDRTFPSVGIITFSTEQRDLISSYLLKLKQQNAQGSEKIRQLERNGMGVFYIDELYGQQFDILMISFTIGCVNVKGSLTRKVVFFNTPEGISHIKLLSHKSPKKVYILHSIPEDLVEKFQNKPHEEGTYLLANFIRLAEYSMNKDKSGLKEVSKIFLTKYGKKRNKNVFAHEIYHALQPYIDTKRIKLNAPLNNLLLPVLIKPVHPDQPPLVIHPDGFFGDSEHTSFYWEYKQIQFLKNLGLEYLPVWSTKWWKSPKQEARRLASAIIKMDMKFKPQVEEVESSEIESDIESPQELDDSIENNSN